MDDIFQQIRRRRDKIANELYLLDKFIKTMEEMGGKQVMASPWFWAQLHDLSARAMARSNEEPPTAELPPVDKLRSEPPVEEQAESASRRFTGNPKPKVVVKKVIEILQSEEKPMTRTEILKELKEHRIVIGGTDPAKVLGTTLWRSRDIIVNIDGHGYWLKTRDYAKANYFPTSADRAHGN